MANASELKENSNEIANDPQNLNSKIQDFSSCNSDLTTIQATESYKDLLRPTGRRALLAGIIVLVFQQLSGVNNVILYAYYFPMSQSVSKYNLKFVIGAIRIPM